MVNDLMIEETTPQEDVELIVLKSLVVEREKEADIQNAIAIRMKEKDTIFYQNLSKISGMNISPDNLENEKIAIQKEHWLQALDETYGAPGALIQPSHSCLKYSLLSQDPDLENFVPDQRDFLGKILSGAQIRGREILSEYSSENTAKAFKGDLVYWVAWLSATGFSFREPININHVKAFIIHHVEGLPLKIDEELVYQGYKQSLGVHKITTVKRRVASLSVHLQCKKLPNPCHEKEVKKLIEKLTKKYGEKKKKSRAITLDVLNAMLETCGNDLIDIRDKAVLLFAWGSGGRRRSEVADAEIKDLEELSDGNYLYHMPKSKTDQQGLGQTCPINGRAANALRKWLENSGIKEGKIFRSVSKGGKHIGKKITDVDINRMVKRRCKKAGYDDKQFSAHSLRSGFITEGARQGFTLGDIMKLSGHRSVNTAMGYYQVGNLKNNKAAYMVS